MKKIFLTILMVGSFVGIVNAAPTETYLHSTTTPGCLAMTASGLVWSSGSACGTGGATFTGIPGTILWSSNGSTIQSTSSDLTVGTLLSTSTVATSTIRNAFEAKIINETVYAEQFSGTNAGEKIINAMNRLPSTGGVIDARALKGAQTINTASFTLGNQAGKPITLLLGAATYSVDTSATSISVNSNVNIIGDNTTIQAATADASYGNFIVTKTYSTTGSITAGSKTLTVADATGFAVGKIVGVMGMNGGNANQSTTVADAAGIDSVVTTITLASATGLNNGANAFMIDNEIVTGTLTGTTLSSVTRGAYGTTAASHSLGAAMNAVLIKISKISGVSGTTITLDDAATQSLTSAPVYIGSANIVIGGTLTIDGRFSNVSQAGNPIGINILLSSNVTVEPTVDVKNFEHGGVMLDGSWYNDIGGSFYHTGQFGVILFRQSKFNRINALLVEDMAEGIDMDDRTTNIDGALPIEGEVSNNTVFSQYIASTSVAVHISGSNNNAYYLGIASTTGTTISIDSQQWTTLPTASGNYIRASWIKSGATAVSMSANTSNNVVQASVVQGWTSISANNSYQTDSTFLVNSSIGIGSTTPSKPLSVNGGAAIDGDLRVNSINSTSTGKTNIFMGNTGIGMAPTVPLHVQVATNKQLSVSNVTSSAISDFGTGGVGLGFSRTQDGVNDLTGFYNFNTSGNAYRSVWASRGDLVLASGGAGLYTAAPEVIRISSTGTIVASTTHKFGIGMTPTQTFQVAMQGAPNNTISFYTPNSSSLSDYSTIGPAFTLSRPNDGATGLVGFYEYNNAANKTRAVIASRGDTVFANGGSSTLDQAFEAMRVSTDETNSMVGIGTSSPYAKLSVMASSTQVSIARPFFVVASSTQNSGTAAVFQNIFTINYAGNVGIGTTSPGTLLSLGSTGNNTINISETSTSTFGSGINLRTGCFSVNGACISGGTATLSGGINNTLTYWTGASTISATNSPTVGYITATSTTATSTFSSSVSIGTTTPNSTVEISGSFHIESGVLNSMTVDFCAKNTSNILSSTTGTGNTTITFTNANLCPGKGLVISLTAPSSGLIGSTTFVGGTNSGPVMWNGNLSPGNSVINNSTDRFIFISSASSTTYIAADLSGNY